ncbi:Gastricsin [Chelonia mydas]|uniref:Gastricsin n=1 Tax=Chelonia mydas TaxID=8469 RepID=M7BFL5_CHEMY|nr:Gastricsin [Chelonia mydas]
MEPAQITLAIRSTLNTTRIIQQYMQHQNLAERYRASRRRQRGDESDEDMDTDFSQSTGPGNVGIMNYGRDIMFGGVDPQLFPGQITWTSITGSSVLRMKSLGPPSLGLLLDSSKGCQGIVDTGTFLLTVPELYMGDFLEAVGAQQNNQEVENMADCSNVQNVPTITFIINGSQFPLPLCAYVFNF